MNISSNREKIKQSSKQISQTPNEKQFYTLQYMIVTDAMPNRLSVSEVALK